MTLARLRAVRSELAAQADPKRAAGNLRFFKTGPGEYGEGDHFVGLTLPVLRRAARGARDLTLSDLVRLLHSKWHEERLFALMLMVEAHRKGTATERRVIRRTYLDNARYVNNWDLVDTSAGQIVGAHLAEDGTKLIERLAKSKSVWERRIAMIATFYSIRYDDDVRPTLLIAGMLLDDEHDLIHKAAGWMLREAEKRDPAAVRLFLDKHAAAMPRTMLRYAIERFSVEDRKRYMGMRAATARSATLSSTRSRRSRA